MIYKKLNMQHTSNAQQQQQQQVFYSPITV